MRFAPLQHRPELEVSRSERLRQRANSQSSLKRTAGSQSVHFNGLSLLAPNSFEGDIKRSNPIIPDQIQSNSPMKSQS
jgi:hypothetical protein